MFKKKKESDETVRTYIDGQIKQEIEKISQPVNVSEINNQPKIDLSQFDCIICTDFGYYYDTTGVWHNCPRCNAGNKLAKTSKK